MLRQSWLRDTPMPTSKHAPMPRGTAIATGGQVFARLRGGGPYVCFVLDLPRPRPNVKISSRLRSWTRRHELRQQSTSSVQSRCNLSGAAPDEAAALGGVARVAGAMLMLKGQVQCLPCAALPQMTQDDPRVPLVPWNQPCGGAIHAWRASGHPHARPSSRPLQPSRPFLPKLSSLITRSSFVTSNWNGLHGSQFLDMIFCCVAQHLLDQQFAQLHHADGMRTSGADAKQHQIC